MPQPVCLGQAASTPQHLCSDKNEPAALSLQLLFSLLRHYGVFMVLQLCCPLCSALASQKRKSTAPAGRQEVNMEGQGCPSAGQLSNRQQWAQKGSASADRDTNPTGGREGSPGDWVAAAGILWASSIALMTIRISASKTLSGSKVRTSLRDYATTYMVSSLAFQQSVTWTNLTSN